MRFDKSYVLDWTNKLYKVTEKKKWNHVCTEDDQPVDHQTVYRLNDPNNDLPRYFMRHEVLYVKKHVPK